MNTFQFLQFLIYFFLFLMTTASPTSDESKAIAALRSAGADIAHEEGASRSLEIRFTRNVDDSICDYLKALKHVVSLDFRNTTITDRTLISIREYTDLRDLILTNTTISDKGMPNLRLMKNLNRIDLSGTFITE